MRMTTLLKLVTRSGLEPVDTLFLPYSSSDSHAFIYSLSLVKIVFCVTFLHFQLFF